MIPKHLLVTVAKRLTDGLSSLLVCSASFMRLERTTPAWSDSTPIPSKIIADTTPLDMLLLLLHPPASLLVSLIVLSFLPLLTSLFLSLLPEVLISVS